MRHNRTNLILLLSACFLVFNQPVASAMDSPEVKFIANDYLKASGLPLSTMVEVDGWIFLSGALGIKPGAGIVEGGIRVETKQTMENIKASLADLGLGMDRVIKCTVMLADMAEWRDFNDVYTTFFEEDSYPARSAFGGNQLAGKARVEVECIAHR